MHRTVVFAIALVILLAFSGIVVAGEIGITVNDEEVWLGFPPFIQDGQAVVPVRPLMEALNAKIIWDGDNEVALAAKDDRKIIFVTEEDDCLEDVYTTAAEVPAFKIQNRLFAPLRSTVEQLGCFVAWNDRTRTIAISSSDEDLPVAVSSHVDLLDYRQNKKMDVNTATFWELLLLGLDEQMAQEIIHYRENHGLFESFQELERVKGINEEIRRQLKQKARLVYYVEGKATSYGGIFHGRRTANGEIYDKYASTAAHPSLPFNTMVEATFLETGKSTWVRINDRGPCQVRHPDRIIDLSRSSAYEIGLTRAIGVGQVQLKIVIE